MSRETVQKTLFNHLSGTQAPHKPNPNNNPYTFAYQPPLPACDDLGDKIPIPGKNPSTPTISLTDLLNRLALTQSEELLRSEIIRSIKSQQSLLKGTVLHEAICLVQILKSILQSQGKGVYTILENHFPTRAKEEVDYLATLLSAFLEENSTLIKNLRKRNLFQQGDYSSLIKNFVESVVQKFLLSFRYVLNGYGTKAKSNARILGIDLFLHTEQDNLWREIVFEILKIDNIEYLFGKIVNLFPISQPDSDSLDDWFPREEKPLFEVSFELRLKFKNQLDLVEKIAVQLRADSLVVKPGTKEIRITDYKLDIDPYSKREDPKTKFQLFVYYLLCLAIIGNNYIMPKQTKRGDSGLIIFELDLDLLKIESSFGANFTFVEIFSGRTAEYDLKLVMDEFSDFLKELRRIANSIITQRSRIEKKKRNSGHHLHLQKFFYQPWL